MRGTRVLERGCTGLNRAAGEYGDSEDSRLRREGLFKEDSKLGTADRFYYVSLGFCYSESERARRRSKFPQ